MGAQSFRRQLRREGAKVKASTRTRLKKQADRTIQDNIEFDRIWSPGFGRTVRRNAEIVEGSFRDIDDLGKFGDPQNRKSFWKGNRFVVEWKVPYAVYVIEGYFTSKGRKIPGRNPAKFTSGDNVFR